MSESPGGQRWWKRPLFPGRRQPKRVYGSPQEAFFWQETWPRMRSLGTFWFIVLGILTYQLGGLMVHGSGAGLGLGRTLGFAMNFLPSLGVLVLAVWGLGLGCERGGWFRSHRSERVPALSLSVGDFASDRVKLVAWGWSIVMLPMALLVAWFRPGEMSMHMMDADGVRDALGRSMALGAQLVVGALPLSLWGRGPGLLRVLGGTFVGGAAAFALGYWIGAEWPDLRRWGVVVLLLGMKLGFAAWGLGLARRRGHVRERFVVVLLGGWVAAVASVVWLLQGSVRPWGWHVACAALFIPLARLAWCPMAVAASRRR